MRLNSCISLLRNTFKPAISSATMLWPTLWCGEDVRELETLFLFQSSDPELQPMFQSRVYLILSLSVTYICLGPTVEAASQLEHLSQCSGQGWRGVRSHFASCTKLFNARSPINKRSGWLQISRPVRHTHPDPVAPQFRACERPSRPEPLLCGSRGASCEQQAAGTHSSKLTLVSVVCTTTVASFSRQGSSHACNLSPNLPQTRDHVERSWPR